MTTVTVTHHTEPDGATWADSVDVPGWVAVGKDRLETLELANSGLSHFLGDPDLDVRHVTADGSWPVIGFRLIKETW